MRDLVRPSFVRATRLRPLTGIGVALVSTAVATGAIYGLDHLAPVVSLSVVYLPVRG